MSGKSINFDDKRINKSNFYKNKKLFNIYDLDVNKILVSKKESYGKKNSLKYFIGYNNDNVIRPLCIKLPHGDNDKYIKANINSYGDKTNTNFQGKKIPKENASYKCLSLIMLDSVIRENKKYYHQTLLEECKYEIKKNKMENLISNDLDSSSSDEFDNKSDNEFDNE